MQSLILKSAYEGTAGADTIRHHAAGAGTWGIYVCITYIPYIPSHPDAEVSNETAAIDETAGCYQAGNKRREMEEADW